MRRLSPRPEDAPGRRARHRDTVISALIAAAAVLTFVLSTDERGLRPILVVTCVTGGLANATLSARRAGWRWAEAWPHLLFTGVATGLLYGIAWATGH
jgi:CHASE2 domain-containing sensor protein